jgi:hypothetical protein
MHHHSCSVLQMAVESHTQLLALVKHHKTWLAAAVLKYVLPQNSGCEVFMSVRNHKCCSPPPPGFQMGYDRL